MEVYVVYGEYVIDEKHQDPEDLSMIMGVFKKRRNAEKLQENCLEMYGDYEFYIAEEMLR